MQVDIVNQPPDHAWYGRSLGSVTSVCKIYVVDEGSLTIGEDEEGKTVIFQPAHSEFIQSYYKTLNVNSRTSDSMEHLLTFVLEKFYLDYEIVSNNLLA